MNKGTSLVAQLVKNPPAIQDFGFEKIPWRRDRLPTPVFMGSPDDSDSKESTCSVGDLGSITGLGRYPGEGKGNPLQYSCLENRHGQRSLTGCSPWGCKELNRTEQLSTAQHIVALGFFGSSAGKKSTCNAGDPSSIPGLGRSPGEGKGYPLQYSWASLVAQMVKNPPTIWETWV